MTQAPRGEALPTAPRGPAPGNPTKSPSTPPSVTERQSEELPDRTGHSRPEAGANPFDVQHIAPVSCREPGALVSFLVSQFVRGAATPPGRRNERYECGLSSQRSSATMTEKGTASCPRPTK